MATVSSSQPAFEPASKMLPLDIVQRPPTQRKPASTWRPSVLRIALSLAILGAVGGWAWFSRSPSEPGEGQTVLQEEPSRIFALGRLEPIGEVIEVWGPSGSGDARIQELHVELGQQVRRGDELLRLDNLQIVEARIDLAQAQVRQAEMRLKQTRLVTELTREQMQAQVDSRLADLELAEAQFRRWQQLVRSQAASAQEFEEAEQQLELARKSLLEARSKLARYASDRAPPVDVALAEADLLVAKASYEEARAQLSQAIVVAPADGRILEITARPGERISQGPALKMGNTHVMLARTEVYESDIAKVEPGAHATLRSSALQQELEGTVCEIATLVKRQAVVDSTPAANTDARVIDVMVRLDDASAARASNYVGLQMTVEIQAND